MPPITITIPADKLERVVSSLCKEGDYQSILEDGTPNPMSRNEFARQVIIRLVKQICMKWGRIESIQAIENTIIQEFDINIT